MGGVVEEEIKGVPPWSAGNIISLQYNIDVVYVTMKRLHITWFNTFFFHVLLAKHEHSNLLPLDLLFRFAFLWCQ